MYNFGGGHFEEHFCDILNSDQWFRRCCLTVFSFLALVAKEDIFFFSSGGHFVQWSRMVYAILVVGIMRNHFCETF